ncbi:MAG: hypothetical protein ACC707_19345 [Thiohalomonadales bacterium]
MKLIIATLSLVFITGCASDWKIHGGPADCIKMCEKWDLEFTAMVGVGNQDRTGNGATACVCQPKQNKQNAVPDGAGSTTSLAAPITAAELAAAQAAYMVRHQQHTQQQSSYYRY